jgi:hypothetical protein
MGVKVEPYLGHHERFTSLAEEFGHYVVMGRTQLRFLSQGQCFMPVILAT